MSSETITRNDLTAILNEVLPPTASEYRKLLYSGVLTSGSITLSESIANFDQIMINAQDNDAVQKTFTINVSNNGVFSTYLDFDRITAMWYVKSMLLSFNGATATVSYNCQSYDGGGASSSSYVAVTEIYGIKYQRVNPPQVEMEDVVIEQGSATATGTGVTGGSWQYRKWSSGRVEAWAGINFGSQSGSVWVSPIYYKDMAVTIPSGIFTTAPAEVYITGGSAQWFAVGTTSITASSFNVRMCTCATSAQSLVLRVYAVSFI